jgi:hypothetical protein
MTTFRLAALAVPLLGAWLTAGAAAPYRPASDSEVLERLPAGRDRAADRAVRAMRALLARDPADLDVALRLAQWQLQKARATSDPRQLGQAQAVLAPWWNETAPPVPVLLLRATIRQSSHAFDAARGDLEQATAREPGNAQAWLTLATIQQVTGDLAGAARSCEHTQPAASATIATICRAAVDGVAGQAARAYAALDALTSRERLANEPVAVQTWAMTLQAELAERLDRGSDAEHWYRTSLAKDPGDAYTLAAYADFLLDANRPGDVAALVASDTPVDNLMLRRAQADRLLGSADAAVGVRALSDRFAALRARGDRVHLREEARFRLALEQTPDIALDLALQNWAVQKEPLDARIALECALAAGKPHAADAVVRWIDATRLEGRQIAALAQRVRAP